MTKNIPCPKCDGHGIISEFTENSVSVQTCTVCDGLGHIEAPMTNADRIRAMSDEELATHLDDIGWDCNLCAEHRRLGNQPLLRGEKCDEKCVEHCLEWLKQPAEVKDDA